MINTNGTQQNFLQFIVSVNCIEETTTKKKLSVTGAIFYKTHASLTSFTLARNSRSSRQRCSIKKGVLKNFTKFAGKYLRQSIF